MGCTVRDKHVRNNRKPRSVKPDPDHGSNPNEGRANRKPTPVPESGLLNYRRGLNEFNAQASLDDSGWGYCTEEQLEEIMFRHLDSLFKEAVSKLVGLGYDEEVALKAILRNQHFNGGMDLLTNILHNSLAYLNGGCGSNGISYDDTDPRFVDLRKLEEYSLAHMVFIVQQYKPHLTRGDAMWCLLMSDLHVGRACMMEMPILPSSCSNGSTSSVVGNVESVGNNAVGVSPASCRFHAGCGFGNGATSDFPVNGYFSYASDVTLQKDIECPKRFNLTPSMKLLLKRNVAMFAAGFRANSKQLQADSQAFASSLPTGGSSAPVTSGPEVPTGKNVAPLNSKNQDGVSSVLSKFRDLNLDGTMEYVPEDKKDEVIVTLLNQIKDLEKQVKERKEWAHQKAMQAARKLSSDLMELKMLRMEREETQRLKKGKQTLEDTTMKRLSEMENALRKASGQVDRANASVRRLESENAEIKAEIEAAKLSASESATTCLEVAKREKKYLKRLLAWEKQKSKLQEEIATEKQKIADLQQQLSQIGAAQKEAEVKWRQEQQAKEQASAQVEEERRLKEAAEANLKRKHEALRLKIDIDFQRHKDDLQRLEQELSRLKASSTDLQPETNNNVPTENPRGAGAKAQAETISKLLRELDALEDSADKEVGSNRECIICMKDEVSVVFLPCAHQVLCSKCNDSYGKKGRATCPCCRVAIEKRIRVFGASS